MGVLALPAMDMEAHDAAVKSIADQVKAFYQDQKPFRIYHGSTNSTRTSQRRADNTIDTSRLNHVLSVDTTTMTAVVEPNVAMDELVDATLQHGLMPPVVMEFPGITVGGGFSGTSGESSSFRYGAFDTTIDWIEIVLGDGTTTTASRGDPERSDLFWGAASAFGTLGVVTLLRMRLRPAKKYVQLRYELSRDGAEPTMRRLRARCDTAANDFVDGIVLDARTTLLCTGRLADELPAGETPRRFTRASDPWFYTRAREVHATLRTSGGAAVDYIPLVDYLFRYDRGAFWVGRYAFAYFCVPFGRLTRRLLDGFMHTRVMYRAVHRSGLADTYMVQDVGVPFARAAELQAWLDDALAIYPLWLCPLRVRRDDAGSAHGLHAGFGAPDAPDLVNFGVWGPLRRRRRRRRFVDANRALEAKVHELGGKKWLYAHAYYTEDEFWAHYDRPAYDALRAKYAAAHLPSVYDKVRVHEDEAQTSRARRALGNVWPWKGLKGFWAAARGGDYLMARKGKTG